MSSSKKPSNLRNDEESEESDDKDCDITLLRRCKTCNEYYKVTIKSQNKAFSDDPFGTTCPEGHAWKAGDEESDDSDYDDGDTKKFENHFLHPDHQLKLTWDYEEEIECKMCGEELLCGPGRVYACKPCNFYMHKTCVGLKSVLSNVRRHKEHPLRLTLLGGSSDPFNCDHCEKKIDPSFYCYACPNCKFYLHIRCTPFQGNKVILGDGFPG